VLHVGACFSGFFLFPMGLKHVIRLMTKNVPNCCPFWTVLAVLDSVKLCAIIVCIIYAYLQGASKICDFKDNEINRGFKAN
jgi:hypothetical protein